MDRNPLPLSFHCPKSWDELDGDGRTRHCTQCDEKVVDLSAHTELGARMRLAMHREAEAPCVRYEVRRGRVRFRRSRLARFAAALLSMVPVAPLARAGDLDDANPVPGQVHLCSTDGMVILGRYAGPRLFRWRRHGDATLHVAADPRFRRLAVRCTGTVLPRRVRLREGEAFLRSLPSQRRCTVRLKGEGRPLQVRFVSGATRTEVEVDAADPEEAASP